MMALQQVDNRKPEVVIALLTGKTLVDYQFLLPILLFCFKLLFALLKNQAHMIEDSIQNHTVEGTQGVLVSHQPLFPADKSVILLFLLVLCASYQLLPDELAELFPNPFAQHDIMELREVTHDPSQGCQNKLGLNGL